MSNAAPLDIAAVASGGTNFDLKGEIRSSGRNVPRSSLFPDQRIRSDAELEAWARMIAPGRGEAACALRAAQGRSFIPCAREPG
jgi:hypothetical protein